MTMRIARNSIAAVAIGLIGAGAALAQEEFAKLVVGDGPFEVSGNNGIFGFVIARKTSTVTFKPCHGPTFEIETNKLKRTTLKCEDGAAPNPHPLNVSCAYANTILLAQIPKIESSNSVAIGTVYEENGKNVTVVDKPSPKLISDTFSKVAQFKACGDVTIGFGTTGAPVVNVVPVPIANQIKMEELYKETK